MIQINNLQCKIYTYFVARNEAEQNTLQKSYNNY